MQPGDLIGHYRLERSLGAGAFATVWLARDEYLDDPVAIKVLADNWARNDDVRARFIDEAKIMRRIDHERIIRVFAVDELASGQPMFVMTYADHGTLADAIANRHRQSRQFSSAEAADLMAELADCLGIVHDFGVVHRDLKPSNVLFRSARPFEIDPAIPPPDRGIMVLADFGLAKDTAAHSGFTMAAGTPAYMAPEQARTTSELDPRADVFAATVIAFELLAGTTPFDASTLAEVRDQPARDADEAAQRLLDTRPDISPKWGDLIARGLAVRPSDRFPSAQDFAVAVRSCAGTPSRHDVPETTRRSQISLRGDVGALSSKVASLLEAFAGEYSADIEHRLAGPVRVAVVGDETDVEVVHAARASLDGVAADAVTVLQLAANDVRLGAADAIVVDDGRRSEALNELLRESPAGPVAMVATEVRAVADCVRSIAVNHDHVRASAALSQLDHDVRVAGSVALSDAWMRIAESVEELRLAEPAFAELAAVRALVSDRVVLPGERGARAIDILSLAEPARRLGVNDSASTSPLRDVAAQELAQWRSYQDSGMAPFDASSTIETVVRSLERLWIDLGNDITVRNPGQ